MKRKKIIIIAVLSLSIVTVIGGIGYFALKNKIGKKVEVYSVEELTNYLGAFYYGYDEDYDEGEVTNNISQEVYLDENMSISEIYVEEGQEIKEGDTILSYNTEELDLEKDIKELELQNAKDNLQILENRLVKLKNTTPVSEIIEESNIAEEEPLDDGVIEEKDGDAYNILSSSAIAFEGDGSTEKPYKYLCTDSAYITGDLINILAGYDEEGTEKSGDAKTAIFEVHKDNNVDGEVIYSYTFIGANNESVESVVKWNLNGIEIDEDYSEEDMSAEEDIQEENDDYEESDEEAYTSSELSEEIALTQKDIREAKITVKECELAYEEALEEVDNAVVTSKIDGVVSSVLSENEASGSVPIITLNGATGLYIQGYLSEFDLEDVEIGQKIIATSEYTGDMFEAEIKEIKSFPATEEVWTDSGNTNTSYYPYIAYIEDDVDLTNGDYVSITMEQAIEDEDTSGIYILDAFLKSENGNYYVLKKNENGKLEKAYVKAGTNSYGIVEILSGLSTDDSIAFAYSSSSKAGAKTKSGDIDALMESFYGY